MSARNPGPNHCNLLVNCAFEYKWWPVKKGLVQPAAAPGTQVLRPEATPGVSQGARAFWVFAISPWGIEHVDRAQC